MVTVFIELIRHILTLLFGVSISAVFLDIELNKKNTFILGAFSIAVLLIQGILYTTHGVAAIIMIYPVITHLPLLMVFVLLLKKRFVASLLAISTAYLCCQIANWFSTIPEALCNEIWVSDLVYTIILICSFIIVVKYVAASYSRLLHKPPAALLSFGIVPIFYYVFDYISTVYTEFLHAGHIVAIEFTPFLMSICYMFFCTAYFRQYEEKVEAENMNKLMYLKQKHSDKEIALIRQNEKNISLLHHDMRHFFSNILIYISNGETDLAKDYIRGLIETVDSTVIKKYCSNETVNMILSSYESEINENNINFRYKLNISKNLPIDDVDLTSILSNGMENAIHAALMPGVSEKIIELDMSEKNGKLLISLANTYSVAPEFINGIPVTDAKGHGLGTRSIQYTAEKLKGNCQFSANAERFLLQVIL